MLFLISLNLFLSIIVSVNGRFIDFDFTLPIQLDTKFDLERIIGGTPTENDQFPFIVSLHMKAKSSTFGEVNFNHFCGGSIVSLEPTMVVTAAHCLDSIEGDLEYYEHMFAQYYGGTWEFDVVADIGRTRVKDDSMDKLYQTLTVKNFHLHQSYDTNTIENDIAVLLLKDELSLIKIPNVTNIELNFDFKPEFGDELSVIGYGKNETNGEPSPTLEYANLEYIDSETCNDYLNLYWYNNMTGVSWKNYNWENPDFSVLDEFEFYREFVKEGMFCAWSVDKDSCQGDSGGPIVQNVIFQDINDTIIAVSDNTTQVGIVSWGFFCGRGIPGVYTNITHYQDWIIGAQSCLKCESKSGNMFECEKCDEWELLYGFSNNRPNGSMKHNISYFSIFLIIFSFLSFI